MPACPTTNDIKTDADSLGPFTRPFACGGLASIAHGIQDIPSPFHVCWRTFLSGAFSRRRREVSLLPETDKAS
jgi:hypothetical protein